MTVHLRSLDLDILIVKDLLGLNSKHYLFHIFSWQTAN